MYELTGVGKAYTTGSRKVLAVSDVNLTVTDGEWLAIRGRTGHGKSTLLNLLGGLDRPTSGQLLLDGRDLGRMRDAELTRLRATTIGFVFQTFSLVPTLSAAENVEAALIPLRAGLAARRRKVAAALDSVGLTDRARHLPSELSGGPAAARRDRPGPGQGAEGAARRRADGQPGRGDPRRDHRADGEAVA